MNTNTFSVSDGDWTALHEAIQAKFKALAADVAPLGKPDFGRTSTKLFPLFSHVGFPTLKSGERHDIVVGIDVAMEDGRWRILADVIGEEDGENHFELQLEPFDVSTFDELMAATLKATDDLCGQCKPVLRQMLAGSGEPPVSAAALC